MSITDRSIRCNRLYARVNEENIGGFLSDIDFTLASDIRPNIVLAKHPVVISFHRR